MVALAKEDARRPVDKLGPGQAGRVAPVASAAEARRDGLPGRTERQRRDQEVDRQRHGIGEAAKLAQQPAQHHAAGFAGTGRKTTPVAVGSIAPCFPASTVTTVGSGAPAARPLQKVPAITEAAESPAWLAIAWASHARAEATG